MRRLLIGSLMAFGLLMPAHAWAANYSDPIDGIFKGVYGNSITVQVPSLVSKSPVEGQDQNGDLSFQVNSSTAYRNFNQLTDLKPGDELSVEYTDNPANTKAGPQEMVAQTITRISPAPAAVVIPESPESHTTVVEGPHSNTQTVTTTTTTKVNSP